MHKRKTKYLLVLVQLLTPLFLLTVPQKASAQVPAGCIWDHDGVVMVSGNGQGCVDTLLYDQTITNGSYWYIQDYIESQNPCHVNSHLREVTAAEYLTIASQPATSTGCGAPPPPPTIEGAGNTLDGVPTFTGADTCGNSPPVNISINIGCTGQGNSILDGLFAVIRVLSVGVGVVIVASTVFAGLQYTSARADPGMIAAATERLRNNVIALLIFIFTFAILNWLVPSGLLT